MKKAKLDDDLMESGKAVLKRWLSDYCHKPSYLTTLNINDTKLQETLFKHFSDVVPSLLQKVKVGGVTKYVIDEKFEKLIAWPLEHFICGIKGFSSLQAYSKPLKFCGRVFKVGDPTYSCR